MKNEAIKKYAKAVIVCWSIISFGIGIGTTSLICNFIKTGGSLTMKALPSQPCQNTLLRR